ncbi:MAG: rRNA adenine N-6-methyltransferase family protein [Phycisphaeraceae bacterium]|nr:rRNA adenine N-6-methyltransferase family protein [Phycisphaeraceae bacterium]
MAQTLLEIKEALRRQGVRPRHRLGQNFLHDANKLRQILEAARPLEDRTVLEIGPAPGC